MHYAHDRYQAHCKCCYEGRGKMARTMTEEAVRQVEQHEKQCEKANYRLREPAEVRIS